MKKWMAFFCLLCCFRSEAQFNRYLVKFKDKNGSPYSLNNPGTYLSQRAIDRRNRYNISLDSTDLPIAQRYIDSVRLAGNVSILNASKWLNQISIETSDINALAHIIQLPFVQALNPAAARNASASTPTATPANQTSSPFHPIPTAGRTEGQPYVYGSSGGQVRLHHGDFLHKHGFHGEGMQMAVIDAGFFNYNLLPTFDSIRLNNRILGTWDFVDNEASVAEDDSHGMHCLSAIAANIPGIFMGTAPESSFYLFRSEDVRSEYPIEEHNFACAAEKADSAGVEVCSVSLGYSTFDNAQFNYSYADMNGNKTISAIAADWAAKKGMLIAVATGNEGNNSWHYLITPADADSVLAVGAVDTLGNVAAFSSYGPSSDGQIKPTVSAVGRNAVVANNNTGLPTYGSGTSYACPNMAGLSTCLWQAFPEVSNMTIIETLKSAANNYNNPNDRTGYGIPDLKKAFVTLQKQLSIRQVSFSQCKGIIDLSIKTDSSMRINLQRRFPGNTVFSDIHEFHSDANYGNRNFHFEDDLSGTDFPSVEYRLKVNISNDTTYLLDSITILYSNPCTNIIPDQESVTISPNPFTTQLNVKVSLLTDEQVSIRMLNAKGQTIHVVRNVQRAGSTVYPIGTDRFAKGLYYVEVYAGSRKLITRKSVRL